MIPRAAVRWQDVPVPERMQGLSRDDLGRPVPWFVAWIGGKPDFRVIGPSKIAEALRYDLCWLCGKPRGHFQAFLVGPMCAVNRATAEPPSHVVCAEYAARVCPFLVYPQARRRETALVDGTPLADGTRPPAGEMIRRNPGVALIWVTARFDVWFPRKGEGPMITLGDPVQTLWFTGGRRAYRSEVLASLAAGLPELRRVAMEEGPGSVEHLDSQIRAVSDLLPGMSDRSPDY